MKLQQLTLHNIASIEDATICFDKSPLATSEVFLITGKTGAGKSTLLDAICLALYATTPRLKNSNMQGDIKEEKNQVGVNDVRQLLRRNTSEGSVELTFLGNNQIAYQATWSVKRARGKVLGKLQSKSWTLNDLTHGKTFTKDAEITAEIKAAVGLDFSQFCRTTMLAQGEFTRFLNSKDDEKAEILEKITGVDIYTQIGARIFAQTNQKMAVYQQAQQKVETIEILDKETADRLQESIEELNKKYDESKAIRDIADRKLSWMATESNIQSNIEKATQAFLESEKIMQGDVFRSKNNTVNLWNSTIQLRQWMQDNKQARHSEQQMNDKLTTCSEKYKHLYSGAKALKEGYNTIKDELVKVEEELAKQQSKSSAYNQSQTIVAWLDYMLAARKSILREEANVQKEKERQEQVLRPQQISAEAILQAVKEKHAGLKNRLSDKMNVLKETQLPELRKKKEYLTARITACEQAIGCIDTLMKEQKRNKESQESLKDQEKSIQEFEKKETELKPQVEKAETRKNACKELRDKQHNSVDKWAKSMRAKLHVGDICPVCLQQIEQDVPHEDILDELLQQAEESLKTAEEEYDTLLKAYNQVCADRGATRKLYHEAIEKYEKDNSLALAMEKAKASCLQFEIDEPTEASKQQITSIMEAVKSHLGVIGEKIKGAEEIEEEVKQCRALVDQNQEELDKATASVNDTKRNVENSHNSIANSLKNIEAKKVDIRQAERDVNASVDASQWKNNWKEKTVEFKDELTHAVHHYQELTDKKTALLKSCSNAEIDINHVRHTLLSIWDIMPGWKAISCAAANKTDNLLSELNNLYKDVNSVLIQLKDAAERRVQTQKDMDAYLAEHNDLTIEMIERLTLLTDHEIKANATWLEAENKKHVANQATLRQWNEEHQRHTKDKPDMTASDTKESQESAKRAIGQVMKSIGEELGGIQQRLLKDKENRALCQTLLQDVEAKKRDYQRWTRINQLFGDSKGAKFRKIAQSYVLSSLIHSANHYIKRLTERYTLVVTPGTFVISIEDAYQGYVHRPASTISGGESFLVSLSLALALSDMDQRLAVDTLFIDEGFGTLSGEPLQNAIATLRQLHTKAGRHVGIISHIEELQERIAVQIRVEQEGNSSSSHVRVLQI